jgi:phage/plasmid primase-like uncharacterized protein
MSFEAIDAFRSAIAAAGLTPPEPIIGDGTLHRFSSNGKHGDDAGWYVLHLDGRPAGVFGDFRTLSKETWSHRNGREYTAAEKAEFRRRMDEAERYRAAEEARRHDEAAETAARRWAEARPADSGHAYLTKKGIKPHGIRQAGDWLLVPVRINGALRSLQTIKPDGTKRFLAGGEVSGGYFSIGGEPEDTLLIAEGFATGASLHECIGHPVVVAFNAGNLEAVTTALHAKHPAARLILCADDDAHTKDNPGMTKATAAARGVGGLVAVPDFGADRPDGASDFNDLHRARGPEAVRAAVERAAAPGIGGEGQGAGSGAAGDKHGAGGCAAEDEGDAERQSQASALVAFAKQHVDLFHDENGDVYAQHRTTHETRRIDGRQFRDWLVSQFYEVSGKAPRDQSVREALGTLAGLGRYKGERHRVYVRVAKLGDAYYLDLAEPTRSRAVRIEPGRWEIVEHPPVRFIRYETTRPLPEPESGGDLASLWRIANIPDDARLLVVTWLVDCLRPETPFPALELIGEQGSAKSTTQQALRQLIDPNACDLRAAPKTVEDVFVSAGVTWLVSYENISHMTAPMQDAICVLATGGGFAKRRLYTDADEAVISVKRPVVLNGISAAVTAQDLVDRTISVETPAIRERLETTELWGTFHDSHGRLLGALLTVMADALKLLPTIVVAPEDRPRLAEFARLGRAVAKALGHDGKKFATEFEASRAESIARTIDASPVATAVIEWFEASGKRVVEQSVKEIMAKVDCYKPTNTDAWPRTPKGFGDALRRIAPALRHLGIEARCLGKKGGTVQWKIAPWVRPAGERSGTGPSAQPPGGNSSEPCPERPDVLHPEAQGQDFRTSRTSSEGVSPNEWVEVEL